MKVETKDATIAPTGTDGDFPGTFEVILSSPTKDRDGDTLLPGEWKTPLPEHITFDQDHAMSVAGTVGSGRPELDADTGNLVVRGTYSSLPRAQEVRTLVKEGHIRTTSVAFLAEKSQEKDGTHTVSRELLNGAFVAIPSNREAVVLAAKAFGEVEKAGARNSKADTERIQSIHDHAAALGAKHGAGTGKSAPARSAKKLVRGDTKSIVGSVEALQDRVQDALQDEVDPRFGRAYLRGVLPADGGGTLVYDLSNWDTGDHETYRRTYTDDGSVVALNDDAQEVDILEVVVPDPDSDDTEDESAATVHTADAAPAAAALSVDADDAELVALRVRSLRLQASAY